jgi:hypothetical protein
VKKPNVESASWCKLWAATVEQQHLIVCTYNIILSDVTGNVIRLHVDVMSRWIHDQPIKTWLVKC